ncbi:MAG: hypothetical protein NZ828_04925 [Alphaproteobacteria bacterium]|nr:hypothetical protein [Alphaproteobacteria bacterium]MCS5596577.1 hypothetical protein [Alphaproteobacteria bacterium]|tara:strand:- start:2954 stop:3385 length:432 start_codon:yes stop_codon:yes gene_type:complete
MFSKKDTTVIPLTGLELRTVFKGVLMDKNEEIADIIDRVDFKKELEQNIIPYGRLYLPIKPSNVNKELFNKLPCVIALKAKFETAGVNLGEFTHQYNGNDDVMGASAELSDKFLASVFDANDAADNVQQLPQKTPDTKKLEVM